MDKFIVGILLGAFFSDPKNRKMATDLMAKGAGQITDMLNKQSDNVQATETNESE